ncbi:MAG: Segregation and condensation protein A [Parcubacteria group bacterium GW2011_GWA2_47_10]|nr:MAG: Segregation and condensation protein A [Parcubacteria group bacterium GW2011_GWA2_47_10]
MKQEQFEGPLDILLEFIEKEKLSINQISLASVADEYVRFVKTLTAIDREELAEFLVVAAQLVLIKSRSLLPNTALSEEEEVSIEELERRLAEHKRLKELSQSLQGLAGANRHMYTREFYSGFESVFYPPKKDLKRILENKVERIFSDIVSKSSDKIEIIVSFLAILELARQQIVSLDQETLFGDIKIKKD